MLDMCCEGPSVRHVLWWSYDETCLVRVRVRTGIYDFNWLISIIKIIKAVWQSVYVSGGPMSVWPDMQINVCHDVSVASFLYPYYTTPAPL